MFPITPDVESNSSEGATNALRATRAARFGSLSARLVQIVRLVRLYRKSGPKSGGGSDSDTEDITDGIRRVSRVGAILSQHTTKR